MHAALACTLRIRVPIGLGVCWCDHVCISLNGRTHPLTAPYSGSHVCFRPSKSSNVLLSGQPLLRPDTRRNQTCEPSPASLLLLRLHQCSRLEEIRFTLQSWQLHQRTPSAVLRSGVPAISEAPVINEAGKCLARGKARSSQARSLNWATCSIRPCRSLVRVASMSIPSELS